MTTPFETIRDLETAYVRLSDGIVHVHFKENSTIHLPQQKEYHAVFKQICEGKKYPFLYTASENVSITKEGREYGAKMEKHVPVNSIAIVTENFIYNLIAKFYFKFYKPAVPYQIFRKEHLAKEWLEQFKNYDNNE